ncbi:MAG: hypothetical protein JSR85_01250 [Proteobacteria bacterium]|nr:hypothetical protein [Pseudomonadota bacterium]
MKKLILATAMVTGVIALSSGQEANASTIQPVPTVNEQSQITQVRWWGHPYWGHRWGHPYWGHPYRAYPRPWFW